MSGGLFNSSRQPAGDSVFHDSRKPAGESGIRGQIDMPHRPSQRRARSDRHETITSDRRSDLETSEGYRFVLAFFCPCCGCLSHAQRAGD